MMTVAGPGADTFGAHWYDGKAEMDGYRLEIGRYGEQRSGHAVMIYVTEPFSKSQQVKVNDHRKNPSDTFNVLKLNLVRDFQTGIYDYNTMISTFVRVSDFAPVKTTFTSAEWCGHVYSELRFYENQIKGHHFSYFEGETGEVTLENPADGVTEDNLFILLRGLRGDYLDAGAGRTVDFLPGALSSRFIHRPQEWTKASISRRAATETVAVPAGEFSTMVYDLAVDEGRNGTFWIESDYPHRIVKWTLAPDLSAELTGSSRLEYWRLNGNEHEKYLGEIGLSVSSD
jgi:hypothetical protein